MTKEQKLYFLSDILKTLNNDADYEFRELIKKSLTGLLIEFNMFG